jgi:hypothetical protein
LTRLQRSGDRQSTGPDIWAPLVERLLPLLSTEVREWAVLKNHARLPVVTGDIDLCVPRERWDAFVEAYLSALEAAGSFAVITCDHYLDARFTFAIPLEGQASRALQIDLMDGLCWRGTRLLSAADMPTSRRSTTQWRRCTVVSVPWRDAALSPATGGAGVDC